MKKVALILFNGFEMPGWNPDVVFRASHGPTEFVLFIESKISDFHPEAWLFWDAGLGEPDLQIIESLLDQPDDLWHAGLLLGTNGQPALLDFVSPNWMLNRDPQQSASSWRVSLRACLVRDEVLRQFEFIHSDFMSLDAAALEWGHRCIQRGVFCRYEPDLLPSNKRSDPAISLSEEDEIRIIEQRFGRQWAIWAMTRAILSGYWNPVQFWNAFQTVRAFLPKPVQLDRYRHSQKMNAAKVQGSVSVLIPTLDRYPYLRAVLSQLRIQSIPVSEIIVVDQTPFEQRQPELYDEFKDLPLRVIFQDSVGQCSSRNAGLQVSRGDYILFIDDDDEVGPNLIELHLHNIKRMDADASCGVANETGADLPEAFMLERISDVFPTNNSLIKRTLLERSGLFDLAFEHGARADADLGMRLYLSGGRLFLQPEISVLHHHASRGGLRSHKARIVTYASSRHNLFQRSMPSPTEIYLSRRYFSDRQTQELYWISIFSTLSLHHSSHFLRLLKVVFGLVMLPVTLVQLGRNIYEADHLALNFPNIPFLTSVIKE